MVQSIHALSLTPIRRSLTDAIKHAIKTNLIEESDSLPLDIHHTTTLFDILSSDKTTTKSIPAMVFITFKAQDPFNNAHFIIHLGAKRTVSILTLLTLSRTCIACWFITVPAGL